VSLIGDNLVASAAILLGFLVIVSAAFLAIRGLQLWRAVKASKSAVEPTAERLTADAEQLQAKVAALTERRLPEVTGTVESLQKSLAGVKVVAGAASEAVRVLTAPLRYLGR
jgi:hypothetical protein